MAVLIEIGELIGRPCACANVSVEDHDGGGEITKGTGFQQAPFHCRHVWWGVRKGAILFGRRFVFLDQSVIFILRTPLDYSGQTVG